MPREGEAHVRLLARAPDGVDARLRELERRRALARRESEDATAAAWAVAQAERARRWAR